MLVYLDCNYQPDNIFRQTPGNDGKWEGWQFTFDKVKQCDYMVVLNHPSRDIVLKCRKGAKLLMIQEPPYDRNRYLLPYFQYFDKVVADFKSTGFPHIVHQHAGLPWLIGKSYKELKALNPESLQKKDAISWVTSNSRVNPGHEPRMAFLEHLMATQFPVDVFGRGIRAIDDKFDGLAPYKYTLAIENYAAADYWTEKIADAFLSWTMPVYYGCSNIGDYFPEGSFIKIDITKPEEAKAIITNAIAEKLWDKNRELIAEARQRVLEKYQLFPYLKQTLTEMNAASACERVRIPADPYSRESRIRQRIHMILNRKK